VEASGKRWERFINRYDRYVKNPNLFHKSVSRCFPLAGEEFQRKSVTDLRSFDFGHLRRPLGVSLVTDALPLLAFVVQGQSLASSGKHGI